MKIRVETTIPVYQTISNGKFKVYREMSQFKFDLATGFSSVVSDVAFKITKMPLLDENGVQVKRIDENGVEELVSYDMIKEQVIRTKAHFMKTSVIDTLFKKLGIGMDAATDSFNNKLGEMLKHGLLEDTKNADLFGTSPDDWKIS